MFCRFFPVLSLLGLVLSPVALSAENGSAKSQSIALSVGKNGQVEIHDAAKKAVLTFSGIDFKWKTADASKKDPGTAVGAKGGAAHEVVAADGRRSIEVEYNTPATTPIRVKGRFTAGSDRVDIQFTVSGLPDGATVGAVNVIRKLASGAQQVSPAIVGADKLGLWRRHEHGGIPVQVVDGRIENYRLGNASFSLIYDVPTFRVATGGSSTGSIVVLFPPAEWPVELLSAWAHERPLGIALSTGKTYNWWTDSREPLAFQYTLGNPTADARKVEVAYWVRRFDGKIVSEKKDVVTLTPGQVKKETVSFSSETGRDVFFVEVSARDQKSGEEVFARTNLTLLPPHEFKSTSANSPLGMADYWPIPDEGSAQRVLDRMGVRWLRHGDQHNYKNITPIHHTQIPPKTLTEPERDAWIKKQLETCVAEGNPWWELGNEINYASASIGVGDLVKDDARQKIIANYVDVLKAVRRVQKETGMTQVKLTTVGIAGMDVQFIEAMVKAGGWDLVDGLALHPGRGNFTPDYTGPGTYDKWVIGKYGTYWNYYGSILLAKDIIKKHGGNKELWLTEVYAPAFPNSFWEDSLRNGAENAVLSLALAKAEGVRAMMWYQLFDGVWYDKLGVNPADREYYFGLIQRDLSFKPALLAYCTAAEALDEATFNRWLSFPDKNTKGLLFDTPRGPMAILWNRADGYLLTEQKENFASPEPWLDTWKTRTPTTLPVTGEAATTINVIGQAQTLVAKNGTVTLPLSGAPVIVYGLDAAKLK